MSYSSTILDDTNSRNSSACQQKNAVARSCFFSSKKDERMKQKIKYTKPIQQSCKIRYTTVKTNIAGWKVKPGMEIYFLLAMGIFHFYVTFLQFPLLLHNPTLGCNKNATKDVPQKKRLVIPHLILKLNVFHGIFSRWILWSFMDSSMAIPVPPQQFPDSGLPPPFDPLHPKLPYPPRTSALPLRDKPWTAEQLQRLGHFWTPRRWWWICGRYMGVSKDIPKMDGENNGKPYQNGWFGGKTHYFRKHPPFLSIHVGWGNSWIRFFHQLESWFCHSVLVEGSYLLNQSHSIALDHSACFRGSYQSFDW